MQATSRSAKELFLAALEIAPAERPDWLQRECSDVDLRKRLERMLAAHDSPHSLLDAAVPSLVPTVDDSITERPGTMIGPYKLLEQIGGGGMGVVFMAEQQEPIRRKVALKLIKPGMDTRQVIARFEAERQALALMDHPNIAKVLDAGHTSGGRPYFVMELVKGLPITEFCDQARLPIRERLELFLSVCQAVQHAHQKAIIHRDIKPSNVVVTLHDGKPLAKVIDFGIAKALGQQLTDKTVFTGFAQLIGTPLYMSPEQAALNNIDVDTRSDIYSLGVLLYELLTGTTPFDKERLHQAGYDELRQIIREEEPPKPSTRISTLKSSPHAPRAETGTETAPTTIEVIAAQRKSDPKRLSQLVRGDLDWIVMKCLEKDRNRRYETASALTADVQHYLHDQPVQACPPSAWYKVRKFVRRQRRALAMAACVVLAFTGLAGGMGWAVRDREARQEALDLVVKRTLDETGPLMEVGKWPEALEVVERADKLLVAAGRAEWPLRLLKLQKDLSMAERLEDIYREPKRDLNSIVLNSGGRGTEHMSRVHGDSSEEEFFWGREQDARYAKEFREFGIDIEALELAEAAARLGRTSIRPALVQALDQWAAMRKRARGGDDPFWKKLVEIARQADHDDWRNQFRDALLRQDRPSLEKLADVVPIRAVSPTTVYLLGQALSDLGAVDKAVAVLREAHCHHPDDFWLNDALGYISKDFCRPPRYDDALRYYSMTVAIRPRSNRTHLAVAWLLKEKGATDEAIAEYNKAIELNPNYAQPWNERGVAYLELHQYESALVNFNKLVDLDPKLSAAWNNRGSTYNSLHQYEKALADLNKAIDLDPKVAVAWHNRGCAYCKLHQYEKALADLNKAIDMNPRLTAAWTTRGAVYNTLGKYDKALADSNKAIELDPKYAMAWHNRGCAYCKLHQYEKALADLNKAINLDPKLAMAWAYRGASYHWLHQYDEALADLNKAIELDPKVAVAWNIRGVVYIALHQYDKALADFNKAVELDPKLAEAWNNRGATYKTLGQWDRALADLTKAIELNVNDAEAWHHRAHVHEKLGQLDGAIADFCRCIELQPNKLDVRMCRGNAYQQSRQADNALADYSKAIELQPNNPSGWNTRGAAYSALHQYDKAAVDFTRAIELDPKNAQFKYNRAQVYTALGQWKNAIEDLFSALQLAPAEHRIQNSLAWLLATCPVSKLRDPEQAVQLASSAVKSAPKDAGYRATLGVARYRTGDWKEAATALQEAQQLFQWSGRARRELGRVLFFLAMTYWHLHEEQKARQFYDQAVQWMEKNEPDNKQLRRLKTESAELLGVEDSEQKIGR
jgi:tetratricopeptide (TPR) repeat protein/serine/threonine protein kinase